MRKNLKIVRLLEPEMCLECRFAKVADVEDSSGITQRMIHCTRADCDNWDMETAEPAVGLHDLEFDNP